MPTGRRTFRTGDGLDLALSLWGLDDPRATCVLVHGYAEYAGRYDGVARALNGAGIEVWAVDLRGHGLSPGPRADVHDFGDYAADIAGLIQRVRVERPRVPQLLLGHSMGGAIALRVALDDPATIDLLILSAPFLRPTKPPPAWLTGLAATLASWLPQLPVQPLDARALSRDPAVVDAYRRDPLTYTGWVKARMGHEMVGAGPALLERAATLAVPTLLMHGLADGLADPQASRDLAAAARDGTVSLRLYPGAYHEIFNDIGRDTVVSDVLSWVDAHLPDAADATLPQADSTR